MPMAMRRAFPYVLVLTSAAFRPGWVATLPCSRPPPSPACPTLVPTETAWRDWNRADACAGHLEDAELTTAPNRFFTARTMRWEWWRSPSKSSTVSTTCSSTFGASQAAILRHVADEHGWDVLILGGEQKLRRGLANLTDAARSRLKFVRPDSLHGIDNDERGRQARDLFEDPLDAGSRTAGTAAYRPHRGGRHDSSPDAPTLRPRRREPDPNLAGKVRGGLEQQRGLADAGLSSEKDERPRGRRLHRARGRTRRSRWRRTPCALPTLVQPARLRMSKLRGIDSSLALPAMRGSLLDSEFHAPHSVHPDHPLGCLSAALLADERRLGGFHRSTPSCS